MNGDGLAGSGPSKGENIGAAREAALGWGRDGPVRFLTIEVRLATWAESVDSVCSVLETRAERARYTGEVSHSLSGNTGVPSIPAEPVGAEPFKVVLTPAAPLAGKAESPMCKAESRLLDNISHCKWSRG